MRFVIAVIIAALLVTLLARPLKRFPIPFYVIAFCCDIAYVALVLQGASGGFVTDFTLFMQRCTLAFILFSVVMFIGVLPDGSSMKARLTPLRRQLAILAFIFALCHVMYYGAAYLERLMTLSSAPLIVSLAISALLVILLVALTITSISQVKMRMPSLRWKQVQKLAYPFYLLIYLHLLPLLLPGALAGKPTAVISLAVYTAIMGAYVILRANKLRIDRRVSSDTLAHTVKV